MEAKKRNSIIIGTVLIIGAATFAYFYSRKKRGGDTSSESLPSPTPPSNSETKSVVKGAVKNNSQAPPVKSATSASNPSVVIPYGKKVYSTGDSVNIRNAPSMSAKVVSKVNRGEEIGLSAGKTSGTWVGVYHKNSQGTIWWIAKQYVKV